MTINQNSSQKVRILVEGSLGTPMVFIQKEPYRALLKHIQRSGVPCKRESVYHCFLVWFVTCDSTIL
jgi:hypothetical protein